MVNRQNRETAVPETQLQPGRERRPGGAWGQWSRSRTPCAVRRHLNSALRQGHRPVWSPPNSQRGRSASPEVTGSPAMGSPRDPRPQGWSRGSLAGPAPPAAARPSSAMGGQASHWPDPGGSKDAKQGRGACCPSALPVLEETEGFVCPHSNEAFHGQGLQGPQRLEDAAHPPRHLAGRVDVVGLRVLREPLLHRPGGRRREWRETRTGVKGQTPLNTFMLRIKNPDPGIAQGGSSNAGTTGQLSGAVRPKLLILW